MSKKVFNGWGCINLRGLGSVGLWRMGKVTGGLRWLWEWGMAWSVCLGLGLGMWVIEGFGFGGSGWGCTGLGILR